MKENQTAQLVLKFLDVPTDFLQKHKAQLVHFDLIQRTHCVCTSIIICKIGSFTPCVTTLTVQKFQKMLSILIYSDIEKSISQQLHVLFLASGC